MLENLKEKLHRARRGISFSLAVCLIAAGLHFPTRADEGAENYLDGWKVACAWSTLSGDYTWDADSAEKRQPKLVVTYRLENAGHAYEPGDIRFEIPGIGQANRDGILKASDLASDEEDSEWDCVWNQDTDTYTFSNRFSVEEGQSVSGGFQLLWTMQARNLVNGYCQEKSPVFFVAGAGQIVMEPISFSFSSVRDRYRISLTSSKLSAEDYEEADLDYIWYKIETRFGKDWLARGLYQSSYYIAVELPEGKDYSNVVVKKSGESFALEEISTESGDIVWGFYPFKNRSGNLGGSDSTHYDTFQIGFLKEHFIDEETEEAGTVTVRGHLDRLYHDEGVWITEAGNNERVDASISFTLTDYSFTYAGYLYSHRKWSVGYEGLVGHAAPDDYSKRLSAVNIYNGSVIGFSLVGTSERNYTSSAAKVSVLASTASNALPDDVSVASASNALAVRALSASVASGLSQIGINGNSESYSLCLGDDKLAIFLTDGSIRSLEDDEYEFVYVTVPSDSRKYDYEVYGAESQDAPFEDYVCLGCGNTSTSNTIQFPEGIRAIFVRVNQITESYSYSIRAGVRLHLDWAAEQRKAEAGEPVPDHENHLVNFSYLRSLYENSEGIEVNDCAAESGSYEGVYGKELAERDLAVYGEYLFRDYSNVWLRSSVTKLTSVTRFYKFEGEGRGDFSSTVTSSGTIQADESGTLRTFSLYTVFPKGVEPDVNADGFGLTGSGAWYSGDDAEIDFENHVRYSFGEYEGRRMLTADFDFSDSPLEIGERTRVFLSIPVTLRYSNFVYYGSSYTASTYLMVHDDGLDEISGASILTDEYDINKNGNTNEKMACSEYSSEVTDSAAEWREYVSKYVKSGYSDGYETETVVRLWDSSEAFREKSLYSYQLDFGLGSSHAKNIDIFDRIEQGARVSLNQGSGGEYAEIPSEWQGEFVSIDTSYAENMKLVPTVYYSTDPEQELTVDSDGWSAEPPEETGEVKAVWVHLDTSGMEDGLMKTRQMTYVEIHMQAPSDRSLVGQKAVNQYFVQFDAYGIESADSFEARYELPSSETSVRLLDTVSKITLQKVDGDHPIGTAADGSRKYAALTGARFQIYDLAGNPLFGEEGEELNTLGQITVANVPYGTYQWEELAAPDGYERMDGRHDFVVDEETVFLEIPNRRILGEVLLTKYDRDDAETEPLAGAAFELFRENGEQVFLDENGACSESGTVGEAVTGADGILRVTGLPWGSYRFVESRAPEGYELDDTPILFTIGKDQLVPGDDQEPDRVITSVSADNGEVPASLRLVKRDASDGSAVQDAVFALYRKRNGGEEDKLIQSGLQTNAAGELEVSGLLFGEYYFVETRNPAGYRMPSGQAARTETVTLGPATAGKQVEILCMNERMKGEVVLSKSDDFGQPVSGAEYALMYRAKGAAEYAVLEPACTTDEAGEIRAEDLDWGDYCFIETTAPSGYELSEEPIAFTVDQNTVQSTIYISAVNCRKRGSIRLTKIDGENRERTLAGAEYELYRTDGTKCAAGTDYVLPEGIDRIITGKDGTIVVTGIAQGGYYLQEITAPESYSLSDEKIRFSVTQENAEVCQEIAAENLRNQASLKINKAVNEVYSPFGEPAFIFRIEKKEPATGDTVQTYYRTISLDSEQTEGAVTLTVDQGYSYVVTEMNAGRYKLTEVLSNSPNTQAGENYAVVDLISSDYGEATFRNDISQYEKLSHTASAVNSVKSGVKLTGISVEYHGPAQIDENTEGYDSAEHTYTVPDSDLTVRALYSDGTSCVLPEGSYVLLNSVADGRSNSYTGTVVYSEEGIEKTAAFSIEVILPKLPSYYRVIMELDGGSIIRDGDTEMTAVEAWERKVLEGSVIPEPENRPLKMGFKFCGWYADPNFTTEYDFGAPIECDTWIYAKWGENYDVKYAVSIYEINDVDADGTILPLTFGPAAPFNCLDTYVSHVPAEGELCIHDLTWEEIIDQARRDPTVFSSCLENGCTHSVWLSMDDEYGRVKTIGGESYSGKMDDGDGASVIYGAINESYRMWNRSHSTYYEQTDSCYKNGTNEKGWPDSVIRNMLNGVVTEGMLTVTNKDNGFAEAALSESTALISCFPRCLQEAIYPRAVKSDTVRNDKSEENVAITRDRLWLLSPHEYFSDPEHQLTSYYWHPLEGSPFKRQIVLDIKPKTGYLYSEEGDYMAGSWFRSTYATIAFDVVYMGSKCSIAWVNEIHGVSPCFSIR